MKLCRTTHLRPSSKHLNRDFNCPKKHSITIRDELSLKLKYSRAGDTFSNANGFIKPLDSMKAPSPIRWLSGGKLATKAPTPVS